MSESAGKYSMMISGAAEPLAEAVHASGMGRFVSGISGVPKGASLERALILHPADILVITDEAALSFAPTAYKKGCLAVLLLSDGDFDRRACVELGVFCAAWAQLQSVLPQLFAACGRLSRSRSEYAALRGKLDDARLINRAKLLLISRLKMSEDEAHRFLERSAMDGCMKLRTVAESIIRTYEE